MSTESLPTRIAKQTIFAQWFNLFKSVISLDFVPRNISGVATDESGSLGASTLNFLRAFIASGYWSCGDIKVHHTYNGQLTPGQGWMYCDGRQVTQANYDSEHGAGAWAQYVGSSPLVNLFLPDLQQRYPIGIADTTQDGSGSINPHLPGSLVASVSHFHQWYKHNASAAVDDQTYDAGGSLIPMTNASPGGANIGSAVVGADVFSVGINAFTDGPSNLLIQPDSIEVTHYMRIV